MNNIEIIKHDVTQTLEGVVAHGCNCQGVMNSGVAKAVRKQWPSAFERYNHFVRGYLPNQTSSLLGLTLVVNVGDDQLSAPNTLFVSNMFTQEYYGKDGKTYASVPAIYTSLKATMMFCSGVQLPLFMPRIGSGLGGLSWDDQVFPVVERLQRETDIKVFVCDWT